MDGREKLLQKPLPSAQEAERCIVGGILMDARVMATAAESLTPEDFYNPLNRRVFSAMLELFKANKPIDPIQIGEVLKRDGGSLESIGGVSTITNLAHGLPWGFQNVDEFIHIVRAKKQVRDLARECSALEAMALAEDEDPATILSHAQTVINAVCTSNEKQGFVPIGTIGVSRVQKAIALRNGTIPSTGLKTGLQALDHVTNGFQPSDLIIIGGRPSMGKSALAGQVAMNAAQQNPGAVIVIFSLEMSKEQYTDRLLCSLSEVDITKFRAGAINTAEIERLNRCTVALHDMHLEIDDPSSINAVQMRSKLLQLRHKKGRLDAVVVDFLQRMTASRKTESRQQEVSRIAQDLKGLAKDLQIPVIALSSLSRAPEARNPPRPRMSDLRESGDIESEADLVAFLYRPEYYDKGANPLLAEFIIEKHRHGPTTTVNLNFLREYTKFTNGQDHY